MNSPKKLFVWPCVVLAIFVLFFALIWHTKVSVLRKPVALPTLATEAKALPNAASKRSGGSNLVDIGLSPALGAAWTNTQYLQKKQALLRLGKELPQADCQFLSDFLRLPMIVEEVNVTAAVKNTVLDVLRGQKNLPLPYHRLLIDLFQDAKQHVVIRDYAVQHLVDWYEESLNQPTSQSAREQVRNVLWGALEDAPATIAGTALLSLQYLSDRDPQIDAGQVQAAALALATNTATAELTRVTALQVCSLLKVEDVLPTARSLAESGTNIPIRVAAIATLGNLGQVHDLDLLTRLDSGELRGALQAAITAAVKHLNKTKKG